MKEAEVLHVEPDSPDGIAGDAGEDQVAIDPTDESYADWLKEQWSPDNVKYFVRLAEANFEDGTSWCDHLVTSEASLYPIHRLHVRPLPNGKWACRPASYMGDDFVSDTKEEICK